MSFASTNPIQARAAAVELVSRFVVQYQKDLGSMAEKDESLKTAIEHRTGGDLEILESPKLPDRPSTYYRRTVVLAGALLGILLGFGWSRGKTGRPAEQPGLIPPLPAAIP